MAIVATNTGGTSFEPVPAGTYAARCFSMIHIGTVKENVMGTEKLLNKVRVSWELPTEQKVFKEEYGSQPYVVSKEFTLSMHEKATLRKFMESWRGKGYTDEEAQSVDITKMLGVPCMLSIVHKKSEKSGNTYAEISAVTSVPRGMTVPPQINSTLEFNYDNFNSTLFECLPDYLKDKMRQTPEYQKAVNPNHSDLNTTQQTMPDDDLPF